MKKFFTRMTALLTAAVITAFAAVSCDDKDDGKKERNFG